jgi:hypothetical protein
LVASEAVLTVSIQDNAGHTTTVVRTFAPVVLDNRLLLPVIRR